MPVSLLDFKVEYLPDIGYYLPIMNHVCIFEDDRYASFFPLTATRPVYDLLIGIGTLYQKVARFFPQTAITLHTRPLLKSLVKQNHPGLAVNTLNTGSACLFINGRVVMTSAFFKTLSEIDLQYDWLFTSNGQVLGAYLKDQNLTIMKDLLEGNPSNEQIITALRSNCMGKELENIPYMTHIWDFIAMNDLVLREDFQQHHQFGIIKGKIQPFTSIYKEDNVFIDSGSILEDYVVLNAENGPIYIDQNVYIEAHTRIEGPIYIGPNTRIMGGKITASTIGPYCKVRGELNHTIILGYSNKGHDGFLGHAYLGEWVNLGALTTNSNLKNTYGEVMLDLGEGKIKTGQTFLGVFLGDYAKTAIGTLFNTGTIAGLGATILGASVHEKLIPPFAWGEKGRYLKCDLSKFLEIARRQMARRNRTLTLVEEEILTYAYQNKGVIPSIAENS